jgi:hypothetical protein
MAQTPTVSASPDAAGLSILQGLWTGSSAGQREFDLLVLRLHPMNVQQPDGCAVSLTSSIQSTLSIVPNLCS